MILAAGIGEDFLRAILQGTPPGAVYALIALGFVLTYKTSGVFNLAFGAQAYVSAAMYFKTHTVWGWPVAASVIMSVFVVAPLIGLVLERLIFRHLRTSSSVAKLVVTIGLSVALPELFNWVARFTTVAGRQIVGIVPDGANVFYDPFGLYRYNRDELAMMAVALVGAVLLGAFFRYTMAGLAMKAVVESPRMTELSGIGADRLSALAWAMSSTFAGMAGVLIAPRFNALSSFDFFTLMVVAIAAAATGRLVSLPRALIGGIGLGWLTAVFNTFIPGLAEDYSWLEPFQENLTPSIPFVVLFGLLTLWPAIRNSAEADDPLASVDPPPPALAVWERPPTFAITTRVLGAAILTAIAVVVYFRADVFWLSLVTKAVIMATICLSITVITGMAGQVSLCQGAFAAIGGFAVFQLADRYDTSGLAAMLVGAVIAAGVGAVLALPVLRLGGVWLAIATLAFAFMFDSVMIKFPWVGGGDTSLLQGTRVPRPLLGPIDFGSDKSFLALAVIVLGVVAWMVVGLREGTLGRTLAALRGSEVAATSIGISPTGSRIVAFAVSAAIAGLGGAMLAMHQQNVNYTTNFGPVGSLFWLVLVVSISARTVEGAVYAGAAFALFEPLILQGEVFAWLLRGDDHLPGIFPLDGHWRFILFGLMAMQFARHPEGLLTHGKKRFESSLYRLWPTQARS